MKKELQSLIDNGIIERSDSFLCSPMVPIRKPNGKIRICIDFRKLNEITPQIQHLIPKFEELVEKVGNSQCLTKLYLMKGFHQLVLDEASRPLLTHRKVPLLQTSIWTTKCSCIFSGSYGTGPCRLPCILLHLH